SRIISLVTSIRFNQPALSVVYDDLFTNRDDFFYLNESNKRANLPLSNGKKCFNYESALSQVYFRYPNQKDYSIKDVS
ncbi:hypothetical protein ABTO78_21820, partial [Acinetobacter baumannii]